MFVFTHVLVSKMFTPNLRLPLIGPGHDSITHYFPMSLTKNVTRIMVMTSDFLSNNLLQRLPRRLWDYGEEVVCECVTIHFMLLIVLSASFSSTEKFMLPQHRFNF